MSLETYTGNISDLVDTNPTGTDPRSQGDDHLRGIKYTLKQSFPLATGPVRVSGDKLFAGDSADTTKNFVIDASADNGTMKLARESGQDIMTVDATGKVGFSLSFLGLEVSFAEELSVLKLPSFLGGIQICWGRQDIGVSSGVLTFPAFKNLSYSIVMMPATSAGGVVANTATEVFGTRTVGSVGVQNQGSTYSTNIIIIGERA